MAIDDRHFTPKDKTLRVTPKMRKKWEQNKKKVHEEKESNDSNKNG